MLMVAYLILLFLFTTYVLIKIWPHPSAIAGAAGKAQSPSKIELFWRETWLWDEVRLLLIVIFAGALGSLVHSIRSLFWYVGNRNLYWSWMLMYLLLPFSGASLALVFYFVIRGGFFSPQVTPTQNTLEAVNPFGLAAIAAIIGLFSQQAVLKLKEVAETLLMKPESGANATPQEALKVISISPSFGKQDGDDQVKIIGTGFADGDDVVFDGSPATNIKVVNSTLITAFTPKHKEGVVDVVITRKGGTSSVLKGGYTYETITPPAAP